MASAMVEGWRGAGADFSGVTIVRPSGRAVDGIQTVIDYPDDIPRFVMLGFKPQKLDEVAPLLTGRCGAETIIVSILAGVEEESLRARFPKVRSVVRAMPNLPVAIGQCGLPRRRRARQLDGRARPGRRRARCAAGANSAGRHGAQAGCGSCPLRHQAGDDLRHRLVLRTRRCAYACSCPGNSGSSTHRWPFPRPVAVAEG